MKQKRKASPRAAIATTLALSAVLFSHAALAAGGLTKAQGFLTTLRDNLTTFIPILAVIAGLLLVVGYWFHVIQKETFMRWIIGLIIAGSITEIVALFVT